MVLIDLLFFFDFIGILIVPLTSGAFSPQVQMPTVYIKVIFIPEFLPHPFWHPHLDSDTKRIN